MENYSPNVGFQGWSANVVAFPFLVNQIFWVHSLSKILLELSRQLYGSTLFAHKIVIETLLFSLQSFLTITDSFEFSEPIGDLETSQVSEHSFNWILCLVFVAGNDENALFPVQTR